MGRQRLDGADSRSRSGTAHCELDEAKAAQSLMSTRENMPQHSHATRVPSLLSRFRIPTPADSGRGRACRPLFFFSPFLARQRPFATRRYHAATESAAIMCAFILALSLSSSLPSLAALIVHAEQSAAAASRFPFSLRRAASTSRSCVTDEHCKISSRSAATRTAAQPTCTLLHSPLQPLGDRPLQPSPRPRRPPPAAVASSARTAPCCPADSTRLPARRRTLDHR